MTEPSTGVDCCSGQHLLLRSGNLCWGGYLSRHVGGLRVVRGRHSRLRRLSSDPVRRRGGHVVRGQHPERFALGRRTTRRWSKDRHRLAAVPELAALTDLVLNPPTAVVDPQELSPATADELSRRFSRIYPTIGVQDPLYRHFCRHHPAREVA